MLVDPRGNPLFPERTRPEWGKVAETLILCLTILSLAFAVTNGALTAKRTVAAPPKVERRARPEDPATPAAPVGADSFENSRTHEGEEITCDLPQSEMIKNIGSHADGAGMCVMSSIEMAARWAGLEQYRGLRDWCAKAPGGAYPQKVETQILQFSKEKGAEPAPHLQYEGREPEKILDMADRNGWIACVTYGYSPRYGSKIAHMTCCIKYNGKYGVILDNNFVQKDDEKRYEWMSREEMVRRIELMGGSAWVFVWIAPGPPPAPHN